MKFVALTGGLGNQLFIYAFCMELRQRGYRTVLFKPYSDDAKAYGHQGYELKKLFQVKEYEDQGSSIANQLLSFMTRLMMPLPYSVRNRLYEVLGVYTVTVPENFIYYPEVFHFKHKHELFRGTWQSSKYFSHAEEALRKNLVFDVSLLSDKTKEIEADMALCTSVSIHIRRGDYLSQLYANGFAGVCTEDYYSRAIDYIRQKVENPVFFVFTDDQDWVRDNFKVGDARYVFHNTGKDSWQDMYLMSRCHHQIIANSSFSWWGAWLNQHEDKLVVAPRLWWRMFDKDDVVPEGWVRL